MKHTFVWCHSVSGPNQLKSESRVCQQRKKVPFDKVLVLEYEFEGVTSQRAPSSFRVRARNAMAHNVLFVSLTGGHFA